LNYGTEILIGGLILSRCNPYPAARARPVNAPDKSPAGLTGGIFSLVIREAHDLESWASRGKGYRVHGLGSPSFLEAAMFGVLILSAALFAVAGLIWLKTVHSKGRWD
jgi:hypothetical protein